VGETSLFKKFFSDCRYVPSLRRYSPTNLCDGAEVATFLHILRRPTVFSASHVQHLSNLHLKFVLRPHHVWKLVDIQSATTEKTRKIKKIEDRTKMWANAQRDGRTAEYRWPLLFNASKFG